MRKIMMAAALTLAAFSAQAASTPEDAVKTLDGALLAAMKAGKAAGPQGRATIVGPVLDDVFDLPEMARLTLGSAAKTLSPEQMAALATAFREFSVANYAANFDTYSGERFEQDPPRPSGNTTIVPTRLIPADGSQAVELDYVLRQVGGAWKITDVLAEGGASQAAANRADFKPILTKNGFDGLMAALTAKTKALAAPK